jgi:hypothetical protein
MTQIDIYLNGGLRQSLVSCYVIQGFGWTLFCLTGSIGFPLKLFGRLHIVGRKSEAQKSDDCELPAKKYILIEI